MRRKKTSNSKRLIIKPVVCLINQPYPSGRSPLRVERVGRPTDLAVEELFGFESWMQVRDQVQEGKLAPTSPPSQCRALSAPSDLSTNSRDPKMCTSLVRHLALSVMVMSLSLL